MSDYIHVNGQLMPYESAAVAPNDAGILHGAGLFETMRARNRKVFRLGRHLDRLTQSAQALSIPFSLGEAELGEMIGELLEANSLSDARLRLTITRGDLQAVTAEDPVPPVTFILSAADFQPYPPQLYDAGMTVIVSEYKQNPESPLTGHKSTSYFERLLGLRQAQQLKAGEALWFTAGGNFLAEGSISNVFLVDKDGVLCTPPVTLAERAHQRLCLPGITRQAVLELAAEQNILPHERLLTINDVLAAREVFLTNAIMGVMPVTHVEKHVVGDGKPGETSDRLRHVYNSNVS